MHSHLIDYFPDFDGKLARRLKLRGFLLEEKNMHQEPVHLLALCRNIPTLVKHSQTTSIAMNCDLLHYNRVKLNHLTYLRVRR